VKSGPCVTKIQNFHSSPTEGVFSLAKADNSDCYGEAKPITTAMIIGAVIGGVGLIILVVLISMFIYSANRKARYVETP